MRSIVLLLLATLSPAFAGDFKAGAVKVDITPPPGQQLEGFFDRTAPAKGTLDPLFARILVLETAKERLAIVTLDLCRSFGPASLAQLREMTSKSSGIVHLLVSATHTHSGPVVLDEYDRTPEWESEALRRIAGGIEKAHRGAVDARLGAGYGQADAGYNRRLVRKDGTVEMIWENPERKPMGPVDRTVGILRIDAANGRPIAVVVNHALHPVVFGVANLEYSADFPAVVTRTVESALGEPAVCLYLQGACGNINPYYADVARENDPPAKREWVGGTIGKEAARVAKEIRTADLKEPGIRVAEDTLTFRQRWDPERFRAETIKAFGPQAFETFFPKIESEYRLAVSTIMIGPRIAIMSMPGEPFVEFQMQWKERCPLPDAFFAGYANGYYGYFPTIQAASEGGYGASDSVTWIEPGAGERMLDRALIRLYEMLGRFRDTPGR